jgi:hypothetical protein
MGDKYCEFVTAFYDDLDFSNSLVRLQIPKNDTKIKLM